ncbi:hypothetical protein Adi01nite_46360 [Amorphoplanes digitatis]|nr:hypothetical protein GCM10020092_001420 [Actinoplanes digitatis]GID95224.1 hypothetical protein Adi01nite_46360 [Actinoplanes digitatis]
MERATGIEPALSAWEPHKIAYLGADGAGGWCMGWPGVASFCLPQWPANDPAKYQE